MSDNTKTLYQDYAELYYDIANDRNFKDELNMFGLVDIPGGSLVVELFAGPAYHSAFLEKSRPDLDIVAVDNAESMKETAIKHGFSGRYIVDDVNNALSQLNNIHCIIVLRYSMVLVPESDVNKLFELASEKLVQGGRLIIEVHPDSMTDPDMYIAGSWNDLDIYERRVSTRYGLAVCKWPASTKIISEEPFIVKMGVEITLSQPGKADERLIFESHEHMHSRSKLEKMARDNGLILSISKSKEQKDSTFLNFLPASTDGKPNLSLDSTFDVSSKPICQEHVKNSGLDASEHDEPLTTHVYNLL